MLRILLLPALLLPVIGCQDAGRFEVTGRVTLDGQPLRAASIQFVPERGVSLFAATDDDGNYELQGKLDRADPMAAYVVRVTTAGEMLNEVGESTVIPERVPPRYNERSELRVEITPGRNRCDLPLASGESVRSRQE